MKKLYAIYNKWQVYQIYEYIYHYIIIRDDNKDGMYNLQLGGRQ